MAYRCISPNFWSDPKVDDDFTPEDKYFYLYLLTNPHTTLSGCYELGKRQACRELGYNEDTVDRLIYRMEYLHKVIRYDKTTKEVLILNWHKYNWSKSPKCLKGVEHTLKDIKNEAFRKYCIDTLSIRYQYPMDTTVSVSVPVSETVTDISSIEESEVLDIPEPQPVRRKKAPDPFEEFADGDKELLDALKGFEQMRNKIKQPMTKRAKQMLCNRLRKDYQPADWVKVLNQSEEHCWQDVYPLKDAGQKKTARSAADAYADILMGAI